jgi:hypothetical protein
VTPHPERRPVTTFPTLFTAYLTLVGLAAAGVATRWLPGRARWATVALLVVWVAFAAVLGATGVVARTDQFPPGLALLTVPVILTLLMLTFTAPGATLAQNIPLRLLLGFQVFRVGVELSLHHLWSLGLAPRIMTLEGGNIEILVAVTAPVAAFLVSRRPAGRRIAWAWNLVGLLSLGNVVTRAVLSAPGPLQLIHAEVPDLAILTYPFTFVPGFMAPLALTLHILAFRALRASSNAAG